MEARAEPPVSWVTMGGRVYEYTPEKASSSEIRPTSYVAAVAGLTDNDCADLLLKYLRDLGKDVDFKRILLRMIERDGVRETVKGLIESA